MQIVDVPGYEGIYAVDEMGSVYSLKFGKVRKLKPRLVGDGYLKVTLYEDGIGKNYYIHRLMAKTFLLDYADSLEVDHIDRDRANNKLSNLRMASPSQNQWNNNGKGYYWNKKRAKWQAQIMKDEKQIYLGCFDKEEDAREAYLEAKKIYHVIT